MNRAFGLCFLALWSAWSNACDDNQARAAIGRLAQKSPTGYALYQKTAQYSSARSIFLSMLKGGYGGQCDLTTAVHEGAHILAGPENSNRYHLITGETVPRIGEEAVFFKPKELYSKFKTFPESNYLGDTKKDAPSSVDEFGYLLDEFNSYTWDAQVSLDLGDGIEANGMLQFMQFVAAYIERAAQAHPATYNRLTTAPSRTPVAKLWTQAHDVLAKVCARSGFSSPYLKGACSAGQNSSLTKLVGEKAHCPASCRGFASGSPTPSRPPSIVDFARPNRPAPSNSGTQFMMSIPGISR